MKNFLNVLCWIGVTAFFAVSFTSAYTQEEISAYNWAYKNGITTQSTIDAANLNGKLTRQELSKMLTNYIENVAWVRQSSYSSCSFTDEDKITPNLKPYTKKICSYKIMGSNGQDFRPTSKVTRAELGTTISRMLWGDRYEVGWKDFYIYHLNALKDQWIMNNLDNPTKSLARRWDTFIMLKRISDRYGSDINLNEWNYTYSWSSISSGSDYVSALYENANVVYEWQDWTKYYYDDKFLKGLKAVADKKWETDLADYLKIEADYYADGLNQLIDLDDEKIYELLWVDLDNIDPDKLSASEKKKLVNTIKKNMDKILKENENRNQDYVDNLRKVVKNISNDKFELKDKYDKTKEFIEVTNSFLSLYYEIIYELLDISLNEKEMDDEEQMSIVFGLFWASLTYQSAAGEYQEYVENWARNVAKILIENTNTNSVSWNKPTSEVSPLIKSQSRARDVARKNDLAQIQTAIITSQQDKWQWPGKNIWATKWLDVYDIENELLMAWMSMVPSDPIENSSVKWLWNYSASKWEYWYMVSTRNWVREGWFVLMAKTEVEGWSNRVVCKNGQWLDKWYIKEWTDLKDIHTCQSFKKWNICSSNNYECTYTDEDELRYILLY